MTQNRSVLIIGGGLSGLCLAYYLSKENIETTILEASPRIGGRIQTVTGVNEIPLELGATWFSDLHPNLIALLQDMGVQKFTQYTKGKSLFRTKSFEPPQEFEVPEAQSPSYRIAGGTQAVIAALGARIDDRNIRLNTKAISITETEGSIAVATSTGEKFEADTVVLSLPPQLASSQLRFSPELPDSIAAILPTVQTWMAGSIKFVVEYAEPFWRRKGYSGMFYAHAGIISEMYDHTNFEENKFGLTGFLNGGAANYTKELRQELVLAILEEFLGQEASRPLAYFDKVWTDKFILDGSQTIHRPHQNNGHPVLQESYMNGRLLFSGTETNAEFPGYMEGAVRSAKNTYKKLMATYEK